MIVKGIPNGRNAAGLSGNPNEQMEDFRFQDRALQGKRR